MMNDIKYYKLDSFVRKLKRIGVEVELAGNYPWIYLSKINGEYVTEVFKGRHGFTVAFFPIKEEQHLELTDITEIFKLIRKYYGKA